MTSGGAVRDASPLGLRLVHAALFLAFAVGVCVASRDEWRHLAQALTRAFHVGAPPQPLPLGASVLAVVGALPILWGLARRRSAPLWASVLILAGVVASAKAPRLPASERSEDAANLAFLRAARRVHLSMVQELQAHGEVPVSPEPWERALAQAGPREDRVRTRDFQPVPPRVAWLASEGAAPDPLVPGALGVHVSPDGASFTVVVVGMHEGEPALLRDEANALLVLRGLYNPDLPAAPPAGGAQAPLTP